MQAIEKKLRKIDEDKKAKDVEIEAQTPAEGIEVPKPKQVVEVKQYFQRVKEYDVDFHVKNTIMMPFWGFVSGVVASMLGIGGKNLVFSHNFFVF